MALIDPPKMQTPLGFADYPVNLIALYGWPPSTVNITFGDPMYTLQQVNARLLTSYPAANVFEFRVPEAGTIIKVELFAPDDVEETAIFDVNTGSRRSNLATIYADPDDRPEIEAGDYMAESLVSVPVIAGELVSIDIDAADEQLRFLSMILTVQR